MQIVLLGPPGVGKGTQAEKLRKALAIVQISTGDMLRNAVREGKPLGKKVKALMDVGSLVPDEVIVALVKERLKRDDVKKGFILDGFPRTVEQARALDGVLGEAGMTLDHVIRISAEDEVVIRRISGRRTCKKCGAAYHVDFQPPREVGVCDRCQGVLEQREDDREETVKNRLQVYRAKTEPLVNYYADRGILREVSGSSDIGSVCERILAVIG